MDVDGLFVPESIAVVGATPSEEKVGYAAMKNAAKFPGPVYGINPNRTGATLFERDFYESLEAVPEQVDLALIVVPAELVPDVVRTCVEEGVSGAVVFSGGFAEADQKGADRQREIAELAENSGLSLLGPNTAGFVHPDEQLYASFVSGVDQLNAGNSAIVAQSGGMGFTAGFESMFANRGISRLVALGNSACIGPVEVLSYLDRDTETEAVGLHLEGTDRGRALLETCRDMDTPVVAYKVGKSDVGDFAESHTASMTGDYSMYRWGFRQYNVPLVDSLLSLLDAVYVLSKSPVPDGPGVGLVSAQAGPGIAITDRLQSAGASFPDFTRDTRKALNELLPGDTYAKNPVDTAFPGKQFGDVLSAVAADPNVDVLLVYEIFEEGVGFPVEDLRDLIGETEKPIVFGTAGPPGLLTKEMSRIEELGIPVVRTPERMAEAVRVLLASEVDEVTPW